MKFTELYIDNRVIVSEAFKNIDIGDFFADGGATYVKTKDYEAFNLNSRTSIECYNEMRVIPIDEVTILIEDE